MHHAKPHHEQIKAVLIDDSKLQYAMMRDFLAIATQYSITLDWAASFAEGLASIRAQQHDVYLIDYQLDERNGLELLTQAIAEGCLAPMILITGHGDPQLDQAAMQAGAVDYLDKSDLKPATLERAIRYATKQAQVLAALRAGETRYHILTDLVSDFAFSKVVQPDGTFALEWITGEAFARITGYTPSDLLQEGMFAVFHPDDLGIIREQMTLVMQGQSSTRQLRIVTHSGDIRWLEVYCRPEWAATGQSVIRLYGMAQDITQRKQAELAEREQRLLAEALLHTAAVLNSTLDLDEILDHILLHVGQVVPHRTAAIFLIDAGIVSVARASNTDSALVTKLLVKRFTLEQTPVLQQIYTTGQPLVFPDALHNREIQQGFQRWAGDDMAHSDIQTIRSSVFAPIHIDDTVIGILVLTSTVLDAFTPVMVSHLQAFANQIALAIRNARQYEQAQELATLNERQRLARELHDAVSQTLFSAHITAQTLPRLWSDIPAEMREQLTELHYLTGLALAEMRTLLTELRPQAIADADLSQLLSQAADVFTRRTRVTTTLNIEPAIILSPEVKIVFYRIAQEALNNAAKHAQASGVTLSLQAWEGWVELCINDNGRGFDTNKLPPNHFGVRIMQERAESVGATCQVSSQPGQGTSITVTWRAPR